MTTTPIEKAPNRINTLNEKPLHEALKTWYAQPGDQIETPVDGYIVDIVRADLLIEIQTRNFTAIKPKLKKLLAHHPLRLVYPIAAEKWIVKLADNGLDQISRRRSPKQGSFIHVFDELIRLPELLFNPNFSLEVLLIQEEETRCYDDQRAWRRHGWVTQERRLLRVTGRTTLKTPADIGAFMPPGLVEPFTTADLAAAMKIPRRLAQKMVYCLRLTDGIAMQGKRSNSILYVRK